AILPHGPEGGGFARALHRRIVAWIGPGGRSIWQPLPMFALSSPTIKVMGRWCTVTVTDEKGQRHSLDIQAESTFDAAHIYVSTAKSQAAAMLPGRVPIPTLATVFEVVADGKVYNVKGTALRGWIVRQR